MSLLEELRADSQHRSAGCSVCDWIADQPNADEWHEALRDGAIRHTAIFRAMRARGFVPRSQKPIETHRKMGHDAER